MREQYLCSVLMPKVHLCLCVTCVHEEIPVRELALPMHRTWHDKSQNTPVNFGGPAFSSLETKGGRCT
jgi:hypothetical protein